jgi:hypothetical protein
MGFFGWFFFIANPDQIATKLYSHPKHLGYLMVKILLAFWLRVRIRLYLLIWYCWPLGLESKRLFHVFFSKLFFFYGKQFLAWVYRYLIKFYKKIINSTETDDIKIFVKHIYIKIQTNFGSFDQIYVFQSKDPGIESGSMVRL